MAGSYNHIVDDQGNLLDIDEFVEVIKNPTDAYDAVVELYGMIWWLSYTCDNPAMAATAACKNYHEGLALSRETLNKPKGH